LTNEGIAGAAPGQESAIGRPRIEESKKAQALNDRHHPRIHRDHPLGFEFAERDVNGPLLGAG
jgi:hypothetical protein